MKKQPSQVFKTIRIYEEDHKFLSAEFPKDDNFAEVIHKLVEGMK